MRHWEPRFIENSRIPVILSKFAPINISAITLGPVVISRGKISARTRRHETIHYQQYLETGFIGFLVLYLWYFLCACYTYGYSREAYKRIKFEQEAYEHQNDPSYLKTRKRYNWLRYRL